MYFEISAGLKKDIIYLFIIIFRHNWGLSLRAFCCSFQDMLSDKYFFQNIIWWVSIYSAIEMPFGNEKLHLLFFFVSKYLFPPGGNYCKKILR